jgi:carbon-monoxide dehydrogenase small subunit
MKRLIRVTVNERDYEAAVTPNRTLTQFLREDLNLLGTKEGCGVGDCGACTVLLDDNPVNSCLILAVQCDGHRVTTIEGIADGPTLNPVQEAFVAHGAVQCGFCTPGMVLSGTSLLKRNPDPSEQEIREAISGNLCRCTGYQKIVEAIQSAARSAKKST